MAELSIRQLLEEKKYDQLLVLELEAERLMPDRDYNVFIGQFVLLYDLISDNEFNTMLMPIDELRSYFGKFLKQEKNINERPSLRYIHYWGLNKINKSSRAYYFINSKHRLNLLDEEKLHKTDIQLSDGEDE